MIRLLVIIALGFAAFWCYNNINFSKIADNTKSSIQNEKTIKAVKNGRGSNYDYEQSVVNNE